MSDVQTSAVATVVTRLWQELLEIDDVAEDYGFYELGGDSILAARLVGRLRTEFGVEVSLVVVFDNVTLKQLVAHTEWLVLGCDGGVRLDGHGR